MFKREFDTINNSINKELEVKDNIIRSLREDIAFREKTIIMLLNKLGLDENWSKLHR